MAIKHTFTNPKADSADTTIVRPVNWNADHTIEDNTVTNADSAQMATKTYKGRTTAATGSPEDVAVATLKTDLVLVKGDVGLGNVDNTADSAKPVSTAQQTALDLKSNLASPTFTGTVTTPAIIVSGETASEIASFDASKNIKSLAVATYPSLTELTYVKGVTSAIQTQLGNKQSSDATLTSIAALGTAADKIAYTTGVDTWAEAGITAAARTVLDDATVAAMVDTLGGAASTGSGGLARATSPVLVTPALGTPASGVLTSCTGLPTAGLVDDAVTYAKIQNVSVTDKVLGRSTAGAGDVEEIACTAAGRALLDDANAAAQRATLSAASSQAVGAFSAVPAAAQVDIPDVTSTKILFGTEQFDVSGWYDAVNSKYTPLLAGYYMFTAKVVIEPAVANKRVLVALYKNGVGEKNVSDVHTASINPAGGGGSTIAYANGSTDYFEVYFYHNFGVATSDIDTAISSTFFQGHYLGSG